MIPGAGRIINKDNIIHFEHVPLVTPNGDVLIEDMSFEVHSGMNVLVCGPNGCGKSSLFRVLGEVGLLQPNRGHLWLFPFVPMDYNQQPVFNVRYSFGRCSVAP